jgi:hypothetical protein
MTTPIFYNFFKEKSIEDTPPVEFLDCQDILARWLGVFIEEGDESEDSDDHMEVVGSDPLVPEVELELYQEDWVDFPKEDRNDLQNGAPLLGGIKSRQWKYFRKQLGQVTDRYGFNKLEPWWHALLLLDEKEGSVLLPWDCVLPEQLREELSLPIKWISRAT